VLAQAWEEAGLAWGLAPAGPPEHRRWTAPHRRESITSPAGLQPVPAKVPQPAGLGPRKPCWI